MLPCKSLLEIKKNFPCKGLLPLLNAVDEHNGMSAATFEAPPASVLSEYIEFYGGEEMNLTNYLGVYVPRIHFLPIDTIEIHLCYHDTLYKICDRSQSSNFSSLVMGGRNTHNVIYMDIPRKFNKQIHVKFKAGGFYRLFGIPESELRNTFFTIEEIFGPNGRNLEDRLNNSVSLKERIEILDRYFIKKLATTRLQRTRERTDGALKLIEKYGGKIHISQLAKELNISKRTLEWQFSKHVGLSPKEYAINVRFKNLLNNLVVASSVNWNESAYTRGYFDQSHLIDEFKTATGYSPELFMREKGKTIFKFRSGLFITQPPDTSRYLTYHTIKQAYEKAINNSEWW